MENFSHRFPSKPLASDPGTPWALAGVVGSGNLEVLMERNPSHPESMEAEVQTSIPGYEDAWKAALEDFAAAYPVGGTRVTIHDQGAEPIVVTFRLRQAYEHLVHPPASS